MVLALGDEKCPYKRCWLTTETLGNGLVVNRTYTADNMPASITNSAVGDYAYSWDENKNKTGETGQIKGVRTL